MTEAEAILIVTDYLKAHVHKDIDFEKISARHMTLELLEAQFAKDKKSLLTDDDKKRLRGLYVRSHWAVDCPFQEKEVIDCPGSILLIVYDDNGQVEPFLSP